MLVVSEPKDLLHHINHDLGHGEWVLIDQKKINEFASVSGDHQWIHVDADRAVNEMPDGKTIAHGLLTLCMSADLARNVLKIEQLKQSINYGIDKVRFTSPVKVGTKIRMNSIIEDVKERDNGVIYLKIKRVVEIEDGERPAMIASTISLLYPIK
ncbi:MAG: MaoC family dehydratase [Paracoccaceae bacterium]